MAPSPLPDSDGKASRHEDSSYASLFCIDLQNGRMTGLRTILVPQLLAQRLNSARLLLHDDRDNPEAWQRAGAVRHPPLEAELATDEPAGRKVASSAAETPVPTPARRARRSGAGRQVPVLSLDTVVARRAAVATRTKFSSEEKKTEIKLMDDLLGLGATRLVGLRPDWRSRLVQLRVDMPNLARVCDRLEACCALAALTRRPVRIPPMLLVGPPGVGKTHFACQVAQLLGVPQYVYPLESAETVSVLTGADKHWGNSEPGQLFKLIVQGDRANPVVVLDELDKVTTGGNHYRPANALHAVLEPSTARELRDKCIDLVFDASYVVYIATANRLSRIDGSLLSRFELFHVDAPDPRAALAIAHAVGRELLDELRLSQRFERPTGEVVQQLALMGSPRQMHKVLAAAIARAVVAGRTRLHVADLLESSAPAPPRPPALH